MSKKLLVTFLLLCLSWFGGSSLGLAQPVRETGDELSKLEQEGWKIVNAGVLKRELRANEVETLVFGVEGFAWKLADLRAQLQRLQTAFNAHPTPELRRTIANHRKEIASTQQMIERARAAEALGLTGLLKVDCTINWGYNATASWRTDVQGVWARASANFSASCAGFSGEVYTYAYAQATVNSGPVTQTFTDGPRSGQSVSASAFAQVAGGPPCESYSYASVTSNNLYPSSYSTSADNNQCPPPLVVSVTSNWPSVIDFYGDGDSATITWTVNISGGTPPYTTAIYRNGVFQYYGTSYTETVYSVNANTTQTITIQANVSDSGGQSASASQTTTIRHHYVYVDPGGGGGCLVPSPSDPTAFVIMPCP